MAIFEVEANGKTFEIEAPDQSAAMSAFQKFNPTPAAPKPGVAEDVAKSGASGLARGGLGLVGLPGTLAGVLRKGADIAADQTVGRAVNYAKTGDWSAPSPPSSAETAKQNTIFNLPTPDQVISGEKLVDAAAEVVPGIKYQPQTVPGEYARTIGEFAPGMLSPGTMAQRVGYGVLAPALASETAGQAARNIAPSMEMPARLVAGLGAGVAGAIASRPATANAAVAGAMGGVDDATVAAAGQLMQQAQARGVALTWPEAVAQVSNGGATGLTSLQHVVENSRGGAGPMGGFMAQRPGQIAGAARAEFDNVGAQSQAPSSIGPAIGRAADDTVQDATAIINRATRPAYAAAEPVPVGAQIQAGLMSDPLFAQTLREVRNNPALNRQIANLPDDAVGVIDMVQRRMREQATNAAVPGQANSGNTIAAAFNDARTAPIAAAETATGSRAATATQPAQVGSYEAARAQQEALRRQYLEPLMAGPIGKLANRDIGTKQAIEALFPSNPLPGSAREIVDAVGALAQRQPVVARQLVRTHIESVFNEATQQLQSGANQFGGAGFAAVLRGNTQQAENLAAAIQGVGGPQVLQGFDEFLNIMSATGQRVRGGSRTAFNQEAQDVLRRGGAVGEAANAVATGGIKLPGRIKDAYEQWRLGRNTEQIARLFTDPGAIDTFRRLAQAAPGSNRAEALAARLSSMALQGAQSADNPVPQTR
ncbi:MAG: hypothetical protein Q7T60_17210 [Sphingopyxis sp.]|nr:hypothetical protein [Sphingopyxis sp.]